MRAVADGLISLLLPVHLLALGYNAIEVGVVATATSTFEEPYTIARKFASMDHISKGRAGWNLVTASNAGDAGRLACSHPVGAEGGSDRDDRCRQAPGPAPGRGR